MTSLYLLASNLYFMRCYYIIISREDLINGWDVLALRQENRKGFENVISSKEI